MKLKKNKKITKIKEEELVKSPKIKEEKIGKDEEKKEEIEQGIEMRKDLEFLKANDVVVFGSYLTQNYNKNSDIDIAIITHITEKSKNFEFLNNIMDKIRNPYDIKIFELLPPHLQISVIKNYNVIFGDPLDISEYFYFFRKLWDDIKYRYEENQFKDSKEQLELMHN